jgi:LacI family transcriptional regulator
VDLNLQQLGATAVTELLATLGGRHRRGVIRQPCRLVVRESTGPPPSSG